jgi:hypothetical protein
VCFSVILIFIIVTVHTFHHRECAFRDVLKAVFGLQFEICTASFCLGGFLYSLYLTFCFPPSHRTADSHSMEDHFLIMKACHIVKRITMQREGRFVLGAISQSQVCTYKFITCPYQFLG